MEGFPLPLNMAAEYHDGIYRKGSTCLILWRRLKKSNGLWDVLCCIPCCVDRTAIILLARDGCLDTFFLAEWPDIWYVI